MTRASTLIAAALGLLWATLPAQAATIYSEDFDADGFRGGFVNSSNSERYVNTSYYRVLDFDGWDFQGGSYLARHEASGDQGILLNEDNGTALVTVGGLTAGTTYTLSFNESGDNRPGIPYTLNVTIDAALALQSTRQWTVNGPGITQTVDFVAQSTSASLFFTESSSGQSSPIVDSILITVPDPISSGQVPEPAAAGLLCLGLLGLAFARRRRLTAP